MPHPRNRRHLRRAASAALLLAVAAGLPGCAGVAETPAPKAERQEPTDKYAQAMRMAAHLRAGTDPSSAAVFYRRAHMLDPARPEPLVGLGESAVMLGAYGDAETFFRNAIALDPANAEVRRSYGTLLLTLGQSEAALQAFREAAERDPKDVRAFNGMGVALDLLGRQAEAQQAYQRGLDVDSKNAALRNNLALSKAISGRYDEAIALLQQLAGDSANGPRVRQNLALAHALDGRLNEAMALAGHDLAPDEIRNNLAFYRALPGLPARELAAVVFGVGTRPAGVETAVGLTDPSTTAETRPAGRPDRRRKPLPVEESAGGPAGAEKAGPPVAGATPEKVAGPAAAGSSPPGPAGPEMPIAAEKAGPPVATHAGIDPPAPPTSPTSIPSAAVATLSPSPPADAAPASSSAAPPPEAATTATIRAGIAADDQLRLAGTPHDAGPDASPVASAATDAPSPVPDADPDAAASGRLIPATAPSGGAGQPPVTATAARGGLVLDLIEPRTPHGPLAPRAPQAEGYLLLQLDPTPQRRDAATADVGLLHPEPSPGAGRIDAPQRSEPASPEAAPTPAEAEQRAASPASPAAPVPGI